MARRNNKIRIADSLKYGFDHIGGYTLDELREIKVLYLRDAKLTPKKLEFICGLTQLEKLDLSNTGITELLKSSGNLANLTTLNLRRTNITKLPESIGNLANLTTLWLGSTKITELPESIGNLTNLSKLDLGATNITKLPESIGNLTNLIDLDLGATNITKLPESIGNLASLTTLNLSFTNITELPESIGKLTNLIELDLSFTKITKLPESIGNLANLIELNLRSTNITELPESIGKLTNLIKLDLYDKKITELPESIGNLANLTVLDLRSTNITELPESIGNLANLRELDLSSTKITKLPESIYRLRKLEWLDLSGTQITRLPTKNIAVHIGCEGLKNLHIPKELIRCIPSFETKNTFEGMRMNYSLDYENRDSEYYSKKTLFHIFMKDTTLDDPGLQELIETGANINMLLEYLNAQEKLPLRENKIIFLGDGEAGKSTIIKRISKNNEPLDKEEIDAISKGRTRGIAIGMVQMNDAGEIINEPERFQNGNQTIKFWDFGGQEILYSMHRCFLTRNSIYVVVVCGRSNELNARVRFWLDNIKDFARDSKVIVVVNKTDSFIGEYIDEYRLTKDYKDFGIKIEGFIRMSALKDTREEFKELSKMIYDLIKDNKSRHPAKWINARRELDAKPANYIDGAEYLKLCTDHGIVNEDEKREFLKLLVNLGVVFTAKVGHFEPDYKVLKPIWLVNAIYAIIENGREDEHKGKNGIFSIEDIIKLLLDPSTFANPEYRNTIYREKTEVQYILIVMRQHRISMKIDDEREFIPALCKDETPQESQAFEKLDTLKYRMDYENLPDNVFHRLMLAFNSHIDFDCVRANNVLFKNISDCNALVRRERTDSIASGKIHILVNKCESDAVAKNCLRKIREKLYEINDDLGIKAKDYIIYEEEVDGKKLSHEVDYADLIDQYKAGENTCWIGGSIKKRISISSVLKFARSDFEVAVLENSQGKLDISNITFEAMKAAANTLEIHLKEINASNLEVAASNRELAEALRHISGILGERGVDTQTKRNRLLKWLDKAGPIVVEAFVKALVSQFVSSVTSGAQSSSPTGFMRHLG